VRKVGKCSKLKERGEGEYSTEEEERGIGYYFFFFRLVALEMLELPLRGPLSDLRNFLFIIFLEETPQMDLRLERESEEEEAVAVRK